MNVRKGTGAIIPFHQNLTKQVTNEIVSSIDDVNAKNVKKNSSE